MAARGAQPGQRDELSYQALRDAFEILQKQLQEEQENATHFAQKSLKKDQALRAKELQLAEAQANIDQAHQENQTLVKQLQAAMERESENFHRIRALQLQLQEQDGVTKKLQHKIEKQDLAMQNQVDKESAQFQLIRTLQNQSLDKDVLIETLQQKVQEQASELQSQKEVLALREKESRRGSGHLSSPLAADFSSSSASASASAAASALVAPVHGLYHQFNTQSITTTLASPSSSWAGITSSAPQEPKPSRRRHTYNGSLS